MNKINIYGNIFGSSGYDMHTKGLANGLAEAGNDVCLITNKPAGWERVVNDRELGMLTKEIHKDGIDIMIGMPHSWKIVSSDRRPFIGFLVWEGDKIPIFWMPYLLDKSVLQIWVPSNHVRDAILNTFKGKAGLIDVMNKIKIVPHGVNHAKFYPIEFKVQAVPEGQELEIQENHPWKPFTFIANKGWRNLQDRGGIQFLVKAYLEEFNSKDKIELKIKLNPAYGVPDITKLIDELKIENKDRPKLSFNAEFLEQKGLNKLYNSGDVFVSTTMAEAFNLGGIEAMACGLPTLQTIFGGQVDYMTKENSWNIEGINLVPVQGDIMYEDIMWNKPDIKEIRKMMRYVFEHHDEVKLKSEKALQDSYNWKWLNSAQKATKFLKEL